MDTQTKPDPRFIAQQLRKPTGDFAKITGEQMNYFNEFLYDSVIDLMQLKNNESILEIGFGNGKFFNKLFSKADNLQISGLEYSKEMIEEANINNQSAISSGKLNIQFGNCSNMPFPDNSFDKLFCINVIYLWEDPANHLKEIRRVLKPGGRFYTGIRTKESMLKIPFTKFGFIIYNENEWKSILQKNDFSFIEAKKIVEPFIEEEGRSVQYESICFFAEKRK